MKQYSLNGKVFKQIIYDADISLKYKFFFCKEIDLIIAEYQLLSLGATPVDSEHIHSFEKTNGDLFVCKCGRVKTKSDMEKQSEEQSKQSNEIKMPKEEKYPDGLSYFVYSDIKRWLQQVTNRLNGRSL